jgi:hypothetical protein
MADKIEKLIDQYEAVIVDGWVPSENHNAERRKRIAAARLELSSLLASAEYEGKWKRLKNKYILLQNQASARSQNGTGIVFWVDLLRQMSSLESAPAKTCKWIKGDDDGTAYYDSVCGYTWDFLVEKGIRFCPYCGLPVEIERKEE